MNTITNKQFVSIRTTSNSFDYKINFNDQYQYVVLTTATIPKSYYGLPTDSVLTVALESKSGNASYDLSFAKGNYNPISFGNRFTAAMAESKYEVLVSYPDQLNDVDTNKFTITFNSDTTKITISANSIYLAHMIGIRTTDANIQNNYIWTSPAILDYQSYNKIVIKSDIVKNAQEHLQEIVSANSPYNQSLAYVCPDLNAHFREIHVTNSNIYKFNILDDEGNNIDFNSQEISLTLCFFKTDQISKKIEDVIKLFIADLAIKHNVNGIG